jgi:hypothetical protein
MSARKSLALLFSLAAGGCAANLPAVPVTDEGLAAPVALFRPICERFDHPQVVGGSRWDGRAELLWESPTTDVVIGVECGLTALSSGLMTLEVPVDIRDPRARDLRAFLTQNGIATLPTVSP